MALLFFDGFDHYDPGTDTEHLRKWDLSNTGHTTSTGRSGSGNAIRLIAATDFMVKTIPDSAAVDATVGFAFKISAATTATLDFLSFLTVAGGTSGMNFKMLTGNSIGMFKWNTLQKTSSQALPVNTWCYIEIYGLSHGTAGAYELRLNGVNVLSDTGVATGDSTNNAGISGIMFEGIASRNVDIDDFYMLDASGSANNTFLGDVKVATVYPDGDSVNDFTAVGTGTTNSDRVDEAAPDDDTTYVHSSTVADEEKYTYAATPSDVDVVHGVQVSPMAKKEDGGVRTIRSLAYSVATEATGDTVGLGQGYRYYPHIFEQDPNASAAWTKATIDAATFGVEIVA